MVLLDRTVAAFVVTQSVVIAVCLLFLVKTSCEIDGFKPYPVPSGYSYLVTESKGQEQRSYCVKSFSYDSTSFLIDGFFMVGDEGARRNQLQKRLDGDVAVYDRFGRVVLRCYTGMRR